jgi:hypothetical protein
MHPRFSFFTLLVLAIVLLPWLAIVALGDWLGIQWSRATQPRHE